MYQEGVPLSILSRILGHNHMDTTKIYTKLSIEMVKEAMSKTTHIKIKDEKPLWEGEEDEVARLCGLR